MSRPYGLKNLLLVILAAFAFSLGSVAQGQHGTSSSWSYPSTNWPTEYPTYCLQSNSTVGGVLVQQSPINVANATFSSSLGPLKIDNYTNANVPVKDNGHTIEAEFGDQSTNYIVYNNKTYNLDNIHFHQPSEHQINGTGAVMEVHLVHKASDGSGAILVIGVLINQGSENAGFKKILDNINSGKDVSLNPIQMIPGTKSVTNPNFYTYTGSLTTPTCTPGVTWVVLAKPITISSDQLTKFEGHYKGNARQPVQTAISGLSLQKNFQ